MNLKLQNLKESNKFLNSIFDNINSAIFIVNKEFRIQTFNRSFLATFGQQEEEFINKLLGNSTGCIYVYKKKIDCGEAEECETCLLRESVLKSVKQKKPLENQLLTREFVINGKIIEKTLKYTTKPISYNNQEMYLFIIEDLTEIEAQNKHLSEINQQKNKLLGMAAHDLRNPISAINSFSMLLLESKNKSEEKTEKFLKYINNLSNFSLNILNDLLDFSKIESGKLMLKKEDTEFITFITKIIEINQYAAEQKNIKIYLDCHIEKLTVSIDSNKTEQVINNLISNAIKYSYNNTNITIKIKKDTKKLYVSVIDQGQGIPENEINKLFKPFQKTSVQATAGERSTGLGLAITKKIINGHGGEINVKSKVGNGSEFYFTLPLNHTKQILNYSF